MNLMMARRWELSVTPHLNREADAQALNFTCLVQREM